MWPYVALLLIFFLGACALHATVEKGDLTVEKPSSTEKSKAADVSKLPL